MATIKAVKKPAKAGMKKATAAKTVKRAANKTAKAQAKTALKKTFEKKTAKKSAAVKKSVKKPAAKTAAKKSIKKIDWANLPFGYMKTDKRFVAEFKNGKWNAGKLVSDDTVSLSECAGVLQYAQTCFEGLKAYTTEDGRIVTFRPNLNGERMERSCERLEMPVFPKERFVEAVLAVVKANKSYVPPYGSGATLYIRPYMFGANPVIGVKPADEYQFRIFVTPVGPYFKGGVKSIAVRISDSDRAAPRGTGDIKAGINYAMSLHNIVDAHKNGFAENIYLDPATHTFIEETGGANVLFITHDGKIVTPKSDTILPSITRRSLVYIAENILHVPVEERKIDKRELASFAECGLCGTAAVISPVCGIYDHGRDIRFSACENGMGPVLQKLYDTLTGIQMGHIPAPKGWIYEVK
ncbi:branched-chain amino acid aminotransferase [Treponema socranskii]|uniref:branched-chain amino acid aminotransferase n=1 Tax=Treponema socranskii TaxID=53419 RepID=UPI0020A5F1DC|nr:branched-chain amino acid aminotransferase [Treponema socranskii]